MQASPSKTCVLLWMQRCTENNRSILKFIYEVHRAWLASFGLKIEKLSPLSSSIHKFSIKCTFIRLTHSSFGEGEREWGAYEDCRGLNWSFSVYSLCAQCAYEGDNHRDVALATSICKNRDKESNQFYSPKIT
jgi:hypothetical protein